MSQNNTSDSHKEVEKYIKTIQTNFWKDVFAAEIAYLVENLQGCQDILSVGCGPAVIESALIEHNFRVTGLDVSAEALKSAPSAIRTVAASAEDMPLPSSSFDAVIYVASLQFIANYGKAIEQTARVLRPRGKIIVMLLNPASGFFKSKHGDPSSYVSKIKHTNLNEIEAAISEKFHIQTEYFLGIEGDDVFEMQNAIDSALYIIKGTKK